jgi:hypothetical protein
MLRACRWLVRMPLEVIFVLSSKGPVTFTGGLQTRTLYSYQGTSWPKGHRPIENSPIVQTRMLFEVTLWAMLYTLCYLSRGG